MKSPNDPRGAKRPAGFNRPVAGVRSPSGATKAEVGRQAYGPGGPPRPSVTRGKTNFAGFNKAP